MSNLYIIYKKKGFKIDAPASYSDLLQLLSHYQGSLLPEINSLRYMDSDNDLIMLASDEDYRAMIESESLQNGIRIYIDDGSLSNDDNEFEEIVVGKPINVIENKKVPEPEKAIEEIKPVVQNPSQVVQEDIIVNEQPGCFYQPPVNMPVNQDKVFVQEIKNPIPDYEYNYVPVQLAPEVNVQQVPQNNLKLEDIRETMIDVLKSNFPDILSLSLKNMLPVQKADMQPTGVDKKLRGIIKTLLTNYREQSHFERAKIDEALGGAVEKLLNYFEEDEDILPPLPAISKKKDSENADIYSIQNKLKNDNINKKPDFSPNKIPIIEEVKVEEPKLFNKPIDIKNITSESVVFMPSKNNNIDNKNNNDKGNDKGSDEKKPYVPDYSCQFVKELTTLPKNLTVNDSTILKTISLKNNGTKKWPEGTTLEYVSGLKFKAVKMASLEPGKDFSTVVQIESPKKPGTFSCLLRFACPVLDVLVYPNDPFELTVNIEGDKKQPEIKPPIVDNEIPKDWAAKLKVVKEIIPDVDEKKVLDILKANPKASADEILNGLF